MVFFFCVLSECFFKFFSVCERHFAVVGVLLSSGCAGGRQMTVPAQKSLLASEPTLGFTLKISARMQNETEQ